MGATGAIYTSRDYLTCHESVIATANHCHCHHTTLCRYMTTSETSSTKTFFWWLAVCIVHGLFFILRGIHPWKRQAAKNRIDKMLTDDHPNIVEGIVKLIISCGTNPDEISIEIATDKLLQNPDKVRNIIQWFVSAFDHNGDEDALHQAARDGNEDVVELLVRLGWPVAKKDKSGRTPFHKANDRRVLNILLDGERSSDQNTNCIEECDRHGWKPLHVAASNGNVEMVDMLIEEGSWIHTVTVAGYTAFHLAARGGHHAVVEILAKKEPK